MTDNKCGEAVEIKGIHVHPCCCKQTRPLWKTVWRFIKIFTNCYHMIHHQFHPRNTNKIQAVLCSGCSIIYNGQDMLTT